MNPTTYATERRSVAGFLALDRPDLARAAIDRAAAALDALDERTFLAAFGPAFDR